MRLLQTYERLIDSGKAKPDAAQLHVVAKLATLSDQLNQSPRPANILKRLFAHRPKPTWRGLYIYGEVGRGKTFLMDLFLNSVINVPKHRIHFHAFMQDVHAKRATTKSKNVIADIADELSSKAKLLCLDEMQISDIADATIIGRLFQALITHGTVIVTTSNLPPGELYKDGLNRNLFLPAIELMKTNFEVISLASPTDYRLGRVKSWESFVTPLGVKADAHIQKIWERLTDVQKGEPLEIPILGRSLHVPEAAHGCARFTFADLCEAPLGPPDYLALASHFQTVFVEKIPALKISQRNEAKRFVLLIDTLYDARVHLVASSAQPPERIYPHGDHRFEFARTVSRLQEMQSAAWWGQKIVET